MAFPIIPLISAIAPLLTGKKEQKVVGGIRVIEKVSKGLLGSKTVGFATGGMVAKMTAAWALPLPEFAHWILTVVIVAEWGANVYLRAITKTPI